MAIDDTVSGPTEGSADPGPALIGGLFPIKQEGGNGICDVRDYHLVCADPVKAARIAAKAYDGARLRPLTTLPTTVLITYNGQPFPAELLQEMARDIRSIDTTARAYVLTRTSQADTPTASQRQ